MSIQAAGAGQRLCDDEVGLPSFVVGEELTKSKSELVNSCPQEVKDFMEEKDAQKEYDLLVEELYSNSKTQKALVRYWVNEEVLKVMSDFEPAFKDKGVGLALCERSKQGSTSKYMWLEFIDLSKAEPEYLSDYDVRRLEDGSEIKMEWEKIKFPKGVYVERLRGWRGRTKLENNIPAKLASLLEAKKLRAEYDALIEAIVSTNGARWGIWKDGEITAVVQDHRVKFKVKGVDLFVCRKNQWVQCGQSGYNHSYRWLEFVDRDELKGYHPPRGELGDGKKEEDCAIL